MRKEGLIYVGNRATRPKPVRNGWFMNFFHIIKDPNSSSSSQCPLSYTCGLGWIGYQGTSSNSSSSEHSAASSSISSMHASRARSLLTRPTRRTALELHHHAADFVSDGSLPPRDAVLRHAIGAGDLGSLGARSCDGGFRGVRFAVAL
jgi:hypothetical protein